MDENIVWKWKGTKIYISCTLSVYWQADNLYQICLHVCGGEGGESFKWKLLSQHSSVHSNIQQKIPRYTYISHIYRASQLFLFSTRQMHVLPLNHPHMLFLFSTIGSHQSFYHYYSFAFYRMSRCWHAMVYTGNEPHCLFTIKRVQ